MRQKLLVLLFGCAFSLPAAGAIYDLETAITLGLKNNTQILAASEARKASEGRSAEAISWALPKLSLFGGYNYISSVPSINISIPTGPLTTIEKTVIAGAYDNWSFKAQLTQQIFDWGKIHGNISSSEAAADASMRDLDAAAASVSFAVKQAYFSVVFAKEALAVSEESFNVSRQHLSDAERKYKEGASSSFEVLRSRVQVSNLKPVVSKAKNNLEIAKLNLKIALGLPYSESIDVSGKLAEQKITIPAYQEKLRISLSTRPELLAARSRSKCARSALDSASASDKPVLAGYASYNYQNPYFLQLSWTQSWNAGLNLNIPLFDGNFTAAKVKQAEAELNAVDIGVKRLEDSTASELKQLILSLAEAKERIEAQKDAVAQAQEYHKIAQVGFKSGTMTNLEVIDAELSLMNAKIGYLQALFDREVIEAGIERLAGPFGVRG